MLNDKNMDKNLFQRFSVTLINYSHNSKNQLDFDKSILLFLKLLAKV